MFFFFGEGVRQAIRFMEYYTRPAEHTVSFSSLKVDEDYKYFHHLKEETTHIAALKK